MMLILLLSKFFCFDLATAQCALGAIEHDDWMEKKPGLGWKSFLQRCNIAECQIFCWLLINIINILLNGEKAWPGLEIISTEMQYRRVLNSIVFLQFPWPLLAIICILTKDLHLFFSSRHVSTTSALVTWWFWLEWWTLQHKTDYIYSCPQKGKVGAKMYKKTGV